MRFKKGDKVVILDASKISQAESLGFENGVEYNVAHTSEGRPLVEHNVNGNTLYFYEKELKYIKKVEEKKMTKFDFEVGEVMLRIAHSNEYFTKGAAYSITKVTESKIFIGNKSYLKDTVNDYFEKVSEECVKEKMKVATDKKSAKFDKGDKVVLTDIDMLDGAKPGSLTKNKEYEVVRYEEKNNQHIEHFVIIDNFGQEFVVAYYEFEYVSIAESEHEIVEEEVKAPEWGVKVGDSIKCLHKLENFFSKNEKYKIHKRDSDGYVVIDDTGGNHSLTLDYIRSYFVVVDEFAVGSKWLRTGGTNKWGFTKGHDYTVLRSDECGVTLRNDNAVPMHYRKESLIKYFEPVQELTFEQQLKEKDEFIEQLLRKIEIGEEEYTALSKEYREFREVHTLLPVQLLDVNQQRKLIIEESKLTYDVWINEIADGGKYYAQVYNRPEQRRCTIILRDQKTDKVISKGIAQCRRNDVYNSQLGYVIALGKAMGKDVNRFMNAVQPELALGQMVEVKEGIWRPRRIKGRVDGESSTLHYLKKISQGNKNKVVRITSDTNAQY